MTDQERENLFYKYTNNHINLVRKYIDKAKNFYPDLSNLLTDLANKHDQSKFKEPEKTPYLYITEKKYYQNNNIPFKPFPLNIEKIMHEATFHHVKNNPHHPEYWDIHLTQNPINFKDRDKPSGVLVDAKLMPHLYIIEMVCDCCAMAEYLKSCVYDWFDKNINIRWKFDEDQILKIYQIISQIWGKQNKVFLGGTYSSNWRDKIIPYLKIDYFNPIVDNWTKENQLKENIEKYKCKYNLFVITPKMEGVYSIAEVTDCSNKNPKNTILTLLKTDENKTFNESQWKSLIATADLIKNNRANVLYSLEETINFLNGDIKNVSL